MVYATSNPESLNLLLPPSLKLKISHEDFIKLALANRNLREVVLKNHGAKY